MGKGFSEQPQSLRTTWEPGPAARPRSTHRGEPMAVKALPAPEGSLAKNTVL